jgi:hypothetical protein
VEYMRIHPAQDASKWITLVNIFGYYERRGIVCLSERLLSSQEGTELLGLFWTLSIVLYVEDKIPQRFGDWICLRPEVDGAG